MTSHLVEIEQKALQAMKAGRLEEAISLFNTILGEAPDWEHGTALYSLAGCYEDLGDLVSAERSFRNALRYEPKNPTYIGGLASFLYLHGDPRESFDLHLALLSWYRNNRADRRAELTEIALRALGKKLNLSDNEIVAKLTQTRSE